MVAIQNHPKCLCALITVGLLVASGCASQDDHPYWPLSLNSEGTAFLYSEDGPFPAPQSLPADYLTNPADVPDLQRGLTPPETEQRTGSVLILECRITEPDGSLTDICGMELTDRHIRFEAAFTNGVLAGVYVRPDQSWVRGPDYRGTPTFLPTDVAPDLMVAKMRASENLLDGRLEASVRANAWRAAHAAQIRRETETPLPSGLIPLFAAGYPAKSAATARKVELCRQYDIHKVRLDSTRTELDAVLGPPSHEQGGDGFTRLAYGDRIPASSTGNSVDAVLCVVLKNNHVSAAYSGRWLEQWVIRE